MGSRARLLELADTATASMRTMGLEHVNRAGIRANIIWPAIQRQSHESAIAKRIGLGLLTFPGPFCWPTQAGQPSALKQTRQAGQGNWRGSGEGSMTPGNQRLMRSRAMLGQAVRTQKGLWEADRSCIWFPRGRQAHLLRISRGRSLRGQSMFSDDRFRRDLLVR